MGGDLSFHRRRIMAYAIAANPFCDIDIIRVISRITCRAEPYERLPRPAGDRIKAKTEVKHLGHFRNGVHQNPPDPR